MKRSEAIAAVLMLCALPFAGGCTSMEDIEAVVENEHRYRLETQPLSRATLEERMREIDEQFREPRTPAKVEYSLETAERSISENNNYGGLWRAMRACAWLAMNHPERAKREEYALRGLALGEKAKKIQSLTVRPEPFYYLALCRGAYCELKGNCDRSVLRAMQAEMEMALALDETYDYCGPHRFLGKLLVETAGIPGIALGTFEQGLQHLRQAAEKCPDFGENHLFLAEALIEDGQEEEARLALERVLNSPVPPDHSNEHRRWLSRAAELLAQIAEDEEVRLEAAAAVDTTAQETTETAKP